MPGILANNTIKTMILACLFTRQGYCLEIAKDALDIWLDDTIKTTNQHVCLPR